MREVLISWDLKLHHYERNGDLWFFDGELWPCKNQMGSMSGLQVGIGVGRRLQCAEFKATRFLVKVVAGAWLVVERHILGFGTTWIGESLVLPVSG